MITEFIENVVDRNISADAEPEDWDLAGFNANMRATVPMEPVIIEDVRKMDQKQLKHLLKERGNRAGSEAV